MDKKLSTPAPIPISKAANVIRSAVTPGLTAQQYKEFLRLDFWFSCAYCTMSEMEAVGIGFEIDHHKPQSTGDPSVHDYTNLMWSCRLCNRHKSDEWPSDAYFNAGFRFVRPDRDAYHEHYKLTGIRLTPLTNAAEYTLELLYLNGHVACRLREIRQRQALAEEQILSGISAIRGTKVDQLPSRYRAEFQKLRGTVIAQKEELDSLTVKEIAKLVARSPLLDADPTAAGRAKVRRDFLKSLKAKVPN